MSILLEGASRSTFVLLGVWLKILTDGVIRHQPTRAVLAVAGFTSTWTIFVIAGGVGTRMRLTLMERAGFAFEQHFASVSASLESLTHYEHPAFRDKLELLQQNQRLLGGSVNALVNFAILVIQIFVTLAVVGSVSPILLALPAAGAPALLASSVIQRWYRRVEEQTAPLSRRSRHLYDLCCQPASAKELRVFSLRQTIRELHDEAWVEAQDASMSVRWRASALQSVGFVVFALAFLGAVIFVVRRAVLGAATPGDVVLTIAVAAQVNGLVSTFAGQISWMMQNLRNAERFRWLLDYSDSENAKTSGRQAAPRRLNHGISFEHVVFKYPGTDTPVLRDFSLDIPAGSVVALVGENGAGKTTVVKLLCKFYAPSSGSISVDRLDLSTVDTVSWRRRVAGGFQDFANLQFRLQQSVGLGDLTRADHAPSVLAAIERAGSSDVVRDLPDGLSTQLGRTWTNGVDLSGGQWQKVALARGLMNSSALVTVLDEPTASLDPEAEHQLFERYAQAARGRAESGGITILVSHRFSTVRVADLICVLDDGRITEIGTHNELMQRRGQYAESYTLQARGYTQ